MYLSNRLYVVTGLVIIAIAICLVGTIGTGIAISDTDPTSKSDTAKMLKDLYDNRTLGVISIAFSVVLDCGLGVLIAGLLYLVFRDRSRVLSITLLVGFIGNAAVSAVSDAADGSTLLLAKDYAHGGAGLNAGDPAILEMAHLMQVIGSLAGSLSGTMIAVAFLAMGWLIAHGPAGNVNPPRAIGWVIIVSGISILASWAGFVTGAAGFLTFIVFGLTTLVFTIWLGAWLIKNSNKLPVEGAAAA
jgi:hypothetical protein